MEHHVAAFAFPFGTHAAPLLTLVQSLAAAAPHVTFSFFTTAKCNRTLNFANPNSHARHPNLKAYDVWDGLPEDHLPPTSPLEAIGLFLKATPANFKTAMEAAVTETGKEITCLIADAFLWFAAEMAGGVLHVPWVPLWTSGPCSLAAHVYTDLIRQKIGVNAVAGNEDAAIDFIPGLSAIRLGDLPEGIASGDRESPFSRMLHKMALTLPQAAAVVINSFEELDPAITTDLKSKFQKFLSVGPFTLTSKQPVDSDLNGCIAWLDKHKPASVAYISFGSTATPPPNELLALAEALEESEVPFLWSIRDGARDLLMPKGFVERTRDQGRFVSWAPQLLVLAHASTGVFVTHCGWNSVSESIVGGVPMICRPFLGDQKLNRRMVEDAWKIGVRVEGDVFTVTGTMKALELILSQDDGKKMRENIIALQRLAINAVGADGGSSENFKSLLEVVTTLT